MIIFNVRHNMIIFLGLKVKSFNRISQSDTHFAKTSYTLSEIQNETETHIIKQIS